MKNWDFFKRFSKKFKIFNLFVFGKIGQKNVFGNFLETNQAFLDFQKREFTRTKNWDFLQRG